MLLSKGERTRNNFFRILRAVWLNPGISRVDLSRNLHLDKATVSTIVTSMVETKIIVVSHKKSEEGRVGRKPEGLLINIDFGYIIGYDIQHDHIALTAVDLAYNKIVSAYYNEMTDKENLETYFIHILKDFTQKKELKNQFIIGMGVATTGIVDTNNQIILSSKPLNVIDEPYDFYGQIVSKLSFPVYIGNDANCCASGILAKYRSEGYKNFLFLYLTFRSQEKQFHSGMRLGMGIGIVINENLYQGEDGSAGEFRSLQWNDNGEVQFSLSMEEVDRLKSDKLIQEKLSREIASNIAMLVNVMNFKTIFIGGDVQYLSGDMTDIMVNGIAKNWPYSIPPECEIKIIEKQDDLISYSAAGMFLQHLFSDPDVAEDLEIKTLWWESIFNHELTFSA
jgi:predicted NBD/HSP70 family sugar kinase